MIQILRSQGSEGADTLLCRGQKGGGQFPHLKLVSEVQIPNGPDSSKQPPNRAERIMCMVGVYNSVQCICIQMSM